MKRKILITFFIISLIMGVHYTKVFAETNIKETISGRFPNYDITAEHKLEIKDNKDTKITVIFKDMTIIYSYAENHNGKLNLKSLAKISYSEPNDTYFLYIENITDSNYQLDYTEPFQYSIYENDKLKKEVKTANAYIDKTKGNAKNIYCTFDVEYDKISEISEQAYIFGKKIFIFFYICFLVICGYLKFKGTRHLTSKRYGGIVKEKEVNYCRELPEGMDLELAYVSLYHCSKISTKKLKNGIIGAFILKWANNNNILITDKGNKIFSIDLLDGNFKKTKAEQELYDFLKFAAGSNNIIDNNEIKIWSRSHKKILEKWHGELLKGIYNVNLRAETESLIGLKKFLLDYSLIDEKKHIEVKVWENYLIYAQLMGIADEVSKQLTKIYPDYSKIGEISVMNKDELFVELFFIWLFFGVISYAVAMLPTMIISVIYYIIKLMC